MDEEDSPQRTLSLPIVVRADDGLYVYESEDSLLRDIEHYDVTRGDVYLELYDSQGRRLELTVERRRGRFLRLLGEPFVVVLSEPFPTHEERLGALLREYLESDERDLTVLLQQAASRFMQR